MGYLLLSYYWIVYSKSPVLRRFAWGTCGGSVTGLQNFLKDALTIYKDVEQGQQYPWFFLFFVVMAAATGFFGLLILTACMKRYDATYSAAMFVGSFVVSASIMSAVHYDTFAGLTDMSSYILYPAGLLILMVGVFILVTNTKEETEEDDEDVMVEPVRKDTDDSQVCSSTAYQTMKCRLLPCLESSNLTAFRYLSFTIKSRKKESRIQYQTASFEMETAALLPSKNKRRSRKSVVASYQIC